MSSSEPDTPAGADPAEPAPRRAPDADRRSDRARRAVLEAAWELLDERGYRALTVEGLATRACVGKATIYRWWPNKAAVVLDALLERAAPELIYPDTGSVRGDLVARLERLRIDLGETRVGRTMAGLIAESQHDPDVAEAFRERWLTPRREVAKEVLERAVARGELRPDIDENLLLDALFGPVYYRLLAGHQPLDEVFVRGLVDAVCAGFAPPTRG